MCYGSYWRFETPFPEIKEVLKDLEILRGLKGKKVPKKLEDSFQKEFDNIMR